MILNRLMIIINDNNIPKDNQLMFNKFVFNQCSINVSINVILILINVHCSFNIVL